MDELAGQPPVNTPQAVHWRFIPALNPDGLFSKPPRRVNANGVDLTRNFSTPNWVRDAKVYWEKESLKIHAANRELNRGLSRNRSFCKKKCSALNRI